MKAKIIIVEDHEPIRNELKILLYRSDHFTVYLSDQKQTDVMVHLTLDVHFRIVPRTQQVATLPKGDDLFEIFLAKYAYLHGIRYLFAG